MYHYQQSVYDTIKGNDGKLLVSKYFYGSEYRDKFLLIDPQSLPFYGHLARKVLMHYAGDHYNPHTICITQEPFIRLLIKSLVEYKVFYKLKDYDWEVADNVFKKVVSDYYDLNLNYDEAIIKKGFKPEFKAPNLIDYNKRI